MQGSGNTKMQRLWPSGAHSLEGGSGGGGRQGSQQSYWELWQKYAQSAKRTQGLTPVNEVGQAKHPGGGDIWNDIKTV